MMPSPLEDLRSRSGSYCLNQVAVALHHRSRAVAVTLFILIWAPTESHLFAYRGFCLF